MSHTPPYTDADVEFVAEALCLHDWPDMNSGWWRVLSDDYRRNARAALDALAAAGWGKVPPHVLPLLNLTANETAALIAGARAAHDTLHFTGLWVRVTTEIDEPDTTTEEPV